MKESIEETKKRYKQPSMEIGIEKMNEILDENKSLNKINEEKTAHIKELETLLAMIRINQNAQANATGELINRTLQKWQSSSLSRNILDGQISANTLFC